MAGIKLSENARVIFFGVVSDVDAAVTVTVSTSLETLSGSGAQRVKISSLKEFPSKGRATQGVRAHTLLKGEDALSVGWVGPTPAMALGLDGKPATLPEELTKRDASGMRVDADVSFIGSRLASP